ncbi:MAG: HPP family protein [Desulfotomaculales bacterium]
MSERSTIPAATRETSGSRHAADHKGNTGPEGQTGRAVHGAGGPGHPGEGGGTAAPARAAGNEHPGARADGATGPRVPAVGAADPLARILCRIRPCASCPPRPAAGEVWCAAAGSVLGVGAVSFLSFHYGLPLLVASFGATAALLYGAPASPFAQPRNVVGGHVVSALAGVTVGQLLGTTWWTITLGVGLAILLMLATRTLHPPGGATAFVAVAQNQGYTFVLTPVCAGAVLLVIIALAFNNCVPGRRYPLYWW